jgi:hypothetical protein
VLVMQVVHVLSSSGLQMGCRYSPTGQLVLHGLHVVPYPVLKVLVSIPHETQTVVLPTPHVPVSFSPAGHVTGHATQSPVNESPVLKWVDAQARQVRSRKELHGISSSSPTGHVLVHGIQAPTGSDDRRNVPGGHVVHTLSVVAVQLLVQYWPGRQSSLQGMHLSPSPVLNLPAAQVSQTASAPAVHGLSTISRPALHVAVHAAQYEPSPTALNLPVVQPRQVMSTNGVHWVLSSSPTGQTVAQAVQEAMGSAEDPRYLPASQVTQVMSAFLAHRLPLRWPAGQIVEHGKHVSPNPVLNVEPSTQSTHVGFAEVPAGQVPRISLPTGHVARQALQGPRELSDLYLPTPHCRQVLSAMFEHAPSSSNPGLQIVPHGVQGASGAAPDGRKVNGGHGEHTRSAMLVHSAVRNVPPGHAPEHSVHLSPSPVLNLPEAQVSQTALAPAVHGLSTISKPAPHVAVHATHGIMPLVDLNLPVAHGVHTILLVGVH